MPTEPTLYPLRFEPIFQYRLWGGRKLSTLSRTPLPGNEPIGEAWILSDREDFPSKVADGPLAGKTIHELIESSASEMLGSQAERGHKYPLLLKFLDAREMLSVQVHPSDDNKRLLPPGERGKTEAWVVLESEPASKIYAGLKPGATADALRHLTSDNSDQYLASISPQVGEGVFIRAGTVHALGGGVLVFEVQQNSDVTFRLFDWDRVDSKTGKTRELHIEDAIDCIDFKQGAIGPIDPVIELTAPVSKERMFDCEFFRVSRLRSKVQFSVGADGAVRVVVCVEGKGQLECDGVRYPIQKGDVFMLPAVVGKCLCHPDGAVTFLEIEVPDPL